MKKGYITPNIIIVPLKLNANCLQDIVSGAEVGGDAGGGFGGEAKGYGRFEFDEDED